MGEYYCDDKTNQRAKSYSGGGRNAFRPSPPADMQTIL